MGAVLVVKYQDRVSSGVLILEVTCGASIGDRRCGARRVSIGVRGEACGRLKQLAIDLPPVVSQPGDFDMDQAPFGLISFLLLIGVGKSGLILIRQLGENRALLVECRIDDPFGAEYADITGGI